MTSLFPHPAYAEDQPQAHTILYLHVVRAAAMTGSFAAWLTAPAGQAIARYRFGTPFTFAALVPRLLRHSGRGLVLGSLLGLVATAGQMRGREEIEWKDRSWRLLENQGEMATDCWALDGAAVGSVVGAVAARTGRVPVGLATGLMGGAGIGMSTGFAHTFIRMGRQRKPEPST